MLGRQLGVIHPTESDILLILEGEEVVFTEGLSEERWAGEDSVQRYRSTLPVYVREWLGGRWML
jgi:hypothetical protein